MDCKQCDKVLEELEHIDDEADSAGIDFVKIDDKDFARKMGVFALPAVVFFRHGNLDPVIYAGDLKNEERLLEWLMLQKDPTSDMIEEYDDEQLVEMIRKIEFVAVYFCNYHCTYIDKKFDYLVLHLIDLQITSRSANIALQSWTSWRTLTTIRTAMVSLSSRLRILTLLPILECIASPQSFISKTKCPAFMKVITFTKNMKICSHGNTLLYRGVDF